MFKRELALDTVFELLFPVCFLEPASLGMKLVSTGSSSTMSPWVAGKNMQSSFGKLLPLIDGMRNYVPPKFFVIIILYCNKSPKSVFMLLG